MIGEVEERRRSGEFLALEEHRRIRPEQSSAVSARKRAGLRQRVDALPAQRIGDLIVVLQEGDEVRGVQVEAGVPRRFFCHL